MILVVYQVKLTLLTLTLQSISLSYHPNRKALDVKHAYIWLRPDNYMLTMSHSMYPPLAVKQLLNCKTFSTA